MSTQFQSKFAKVMVIGIFGIMILSFALSGFQGDITFISDSGPTVAKVGSSSVSLREYRNALAQQVDMYSKMMGGKPLTEQQIEQFGVKQMVLKRLIDKKLIESLALDIGVGLSDKEIMEEIKKLPYFQSNGDFDVQKYKTLLTQNQFTPQQFELNVSHDLTAQKMDTLLDSLKLASKNYAKDYAKFKNTFTTLNAVEFSKESLRSKLSVSAKEISDYLKVEENSKKLSAIFDGQKFKYNKSEQVKARHILLRTDGKNDDAVKKEINKIKTTLTTANFQKIAKEKSQDSSASKGGDLGWFERGRMVKEFEQVAFTSAKGSISTPIKTQFGYHIIYVEDKKAAVTKTYNDVKNELASEQIKKDKTEELDKLFEEVKKDAQNLLANNKLAELEKLSAQYGLQFSKEQKLNKIDNKSGKVSFSDDESKKLADSSNTGKVLDMSTALKGKFTKVINTKQEKFDDKQVSDAINSQNEVLNNQLRENLLKELEVSMGIKTYSNRL